LILFQNVYFYKEA